MRDASTLPTDLRTAIDRAGYYPDLLADVVDVALGGEPVVSHLVHQQEQSEIVSDALAEGSITRTRKVRLVARRKK